MTAPPASPWRKLLRDCGLFLLLAAIAASLAGWLHPKRPAWHWSKPTVAEVELSEINRWPPPILWIDARTPEAYRAQHVPTAVLLNEGEWEQLLPGFLEAWQPQSRLVVYCDSAACDASQAVARRLQRELKLTEIYVLKGGWAAWRNQHP